MIAFKILISKKSLSQFKGAQVFVGTVKEGMFQKFKNP